MALVHFYSIYEKFSYISKEDSDSLYSSEELRWILHVIKKSENSNDIRKNFSGAFLLILHFIFSK
jgi:hypothetical protein